MTIEYERRPAIIKCNVEWKMNQKHTNMKWNEKQTTTIDHYIGNKEYVAHKKCEVKIKSDGFAHCIFNM